MKHARASRAHENSILQLSWSVIASLTVVSSFNCSLEFSMLDCIRHETLAVEKVQQLLRVLNLAIFHAIAAKMQVNAFKTAKLQRTYLKNDN